MLIALLRMEMSRCISCAKHPHRTPFKRVESLLLRTKSAPEEELEDMLPVVPRTRIFLTSNGLTTPSLKAAFYTALSVRHTFRRPLRLLSSPALPSSRP